MPFRPESLSTYRMNLWSLPGSTGALRSSSMATSSSHLSSVFAHGQHSNLTPSIVHSLNAGILSSDLISYPGVPAQATRCADPLGGVQNRNVRDSVQRQHKQIPGSVRGPNEFDDSDDSVQRQQKQIPGSVRGPNEFDDSDDSVQRQQKQIPGSVRGPNEFDDSDEWLRCLANGNLDGIIATDVTADFLQMAGSAPVSSPLNSEKCQPMTHQSVPSNSRQLHPTISPPSATNIHSPKRTKARMRWTVEMHDRFRDAVNQLGGSDNATPKAILGLMKVEGLTRDQVKSHLQKYKSAQVKHHSSEGTSVETTMPTEVVPSCVQIMEAFALRVQMEFQKKLHDMVDKTHHDLMEIHSRMFEKHVMNLHELEKRRKLSVDSMSHLSSPAAALASASATLPEDRSNSNAKLDADGHVSSTVELQRMPETGSHGDAGA